MAGTLQLKQGHSIENIVNNVDILISSGIDKDAAVGVAFNLARGWYKDMFNESPLPEHLQPGNCMKAYNAATEGVEQG